MMRATKTNTTSATNHRFSHYQKIAGVIALLMICLTLLGDDKQALAMEPEPPEMGEVAILFFDANETQPGEWEISGQVVNHDGENTVVDFGDYLAGDSIETDMDGFFVIYCYASGGENVTAVASCINGTSDEVERQLN